MPASEVFILNSNHLILNPKPGCQLFEWEQAPNASPPKIEDGEAIDLFGVFTSVTLDPINKNLLRASRKKQQALNSFSGPPELH
jgi:hypothetical protein